MNWISLLGLCLIILGTIFSFYGTYLSDKKSQLELTTKIQEKNTIIDEINGNNIKLIQQNSILVTSNGEVSNSNKDLINQSTDLLFKIEKYQKEIEIRNKKIEELEENFENLKDYNYYSTLNILGLNMNPGFGIKISSDLSDRMEKLLVNKDGTYYPKLDLNNISSIDEVIKRYPNFPFGYYIKAIVLKHFGKNDWQVCALRALEILKITTTINGHNGSHDQALIIIKRELNIK